MTTTPANWITTQATVTTCTYQFAGLSSLAFGFNTRQKFRITFDYYAHGQLYSGEFQSPTAIPQNDHFPITYNPLHPAENNRASAPPAPISPRRQLLTIGVLGSVLLSFAWLLILRSCN